VLLLLGRQLPFTSVDLLPEHDRQLLWPKSEQLEQLKSHFQQALSSKKKVGSQPEQVLPAYCKKDLHVWQFVDALPKHVSHVWSQLPYRTSRLLMPYTAGLVKLLSKLMVRVSSLSEKEYSKEKT